MAEACGDASEFPALGLGSAIALGLLRLRGLPSTVGAAEMSWPGLFDRTLRVGAAKFFSAGAVASAPATSGAEASGAAPAGADSSTGGAAGADTAGAEAAGAEALCAEAAVAEALCAEAAAAEALCAEAAVAEALCVDAEVAEALCHRCVTTTRRTGRGTGRGLLGALVRTCVSLTKLTVQWSSHPS